MSIRDGFPARRLQACPALLSFLLCSVCLSVPAEAQHGGGGHGGFGGGHFGGGHFGGHMHSSGGGHGGGHFHWMKLGFGKHSARGSDTASESPNGWVSSLWNFNTPGYAATSHRLPSTMLWTPGRMKSGSGLGLIQPGSGHRLSFSASRGHTSRARLRRGSYFRRYPFAGPSGCFFNGATQVCYFEPFLALCFGDFGYGDDFGFGADSDGDSTAMEPEEMAETEPPAASSEENAAPENSANENAAASLQARLGATEDWDLSKNVYVLVLQNGTTHAVTNYWVADGYLEYVSPDGTRSHIPLDALDLEGTVERNESRGIPFVVRSAPGR
jgi:hypothetical protein